VSLVKRSLVLVFVPSDTHGATILSNEQLFLVLSLSAPLVECLITAVDQTLQENSGCNEVWLVDHVLNSSFLHEVRDYSILVTVIELDGRALVVSDGCGEHN